MKGDSVQRVSLFLFAKQQSKCVYPMGCCVHRSRGLLDHKRNDRLALLGVRAVSLQVTLVLAQGPHRHLVGSSGHEHVDCSSFNTSKPMIHVSARGKAPCYRNSQPRTREKAHHDSEPNPSKHLGGVVRAGDECKQRTSRGHAAGGVGLGEHTDQHSVNNSRQTWHHWALHAPRDGWNAGTDALRRSGSPTQ